MIEVGPQNWAEIAEKMRRYWEGFPAQILILAQNGWFISSDHTPLAAIYPVAELFGKGNVTEGHDQMCAHFEQNRQDIEDDLKERFPDRRQILSKVFAAHDAGDYELSVPVFLAQADGIAEKTFGVSILCKGKGSIAAMREKIPSISGVGVGRLLLDLLLEALPIRENTKLPEYRPEELNRHAVLHGIDTAYAKKLNSYKAISLLEFAGFLTIISTEFSTLGADENPREEAALHELEAPLDDRIGSVKDGSVGRRTVGEIYRPASCGANGKSR